MAVPLVHKICCSGGIPETPALPTGELQRATNQVHDNKHLHSQGQCSMDPFKAWPVACSTQSMLAQSSSWLCLGLVQLLYTQQPSFPHSMQVETQHFLLSWSKPC